MNVIKGKRCFESGAQIGADVCSYKPEQELWTKTVHNHDYIEIAIITEGSGIHKINNTSYTVKKGDVCIINTESIHCITPVDDENSQKLAVIFISLYPECIYDMKLEPSILNDVINMLSFKFCYTQNNKYSFALNREEMEQIKYSFGKMAEEQENNKSGSMDMLKMYLCIILIELFRCYSKSVKPAPAIDNYHFSLVKKVINYLGEHYAQNVSLAELSEYCHVSTRHLSRIFKSATSMTVFEYLQKIRIEKACFLLNTTDQKVTDIVESVGFTDYRYFSKIFKNYTGLTPKKYANKGER